MKRAVLYARVSTFDQHPETQLLDLRRLAEQRGFGIVHEYIDKISGAKAKRWDCHWLRSPCNWFDIQHSPDPRD